MAVTLKLLAIFRTDLVKQKHLERRINIIYCNTSGLPSQDVLKQLSRIQLGFNFT